MKIINFECKTETKFKAINYIDRRMNIKKENRLKTTAEYLQMNLIEVTIGVKKTTS